MIFSRLLNIKQLRKQKAEKQILQDKNQVDKQQQQLNIAEQQLQEHYHHHKNTGTAIFSNASTSSNFTCPMAKLAGTTAIFSMAKRQIN